MILHSQDDVKTIFALPLSIGSPGERLLGKVYSERGAGEKDSV